VNQPKTLEPVRSIFCQDTSHSSRRERHLPVVRQTRIGVDLGAELYDFFELAQNHGKGFGAKENC
jgi:hypothetical protein